MQTCCNQSESVCTDDVLNFGYIYTKQAEGACVTLVLVCCGIFAFLLQSHELGLSVVNISFCV